MVFKKIRLVVLLLAIVFGLSLGRVYAQEIIRIVGVTVVGDEEFRNNWGPNYYWKVKTARIVEEASRAFEEQVGIRFEVVRFKEWNSEERLPLLHYNPFPELEEEVKLENTEIAIVFSGQFDPVALGQATRLGRYAFVVDVSSNISGAEEFCEKNKEFLRGLKGWETWRDWCVNFIAPLLCVDSSVVLVHELGHIFGAEHTLSPHSVMVMDVSSLDTTRFDEVNLIIISRNKDVNFGTVRTLREKAEVSKGMAIKLTRGITKTAEEERWELHRKIAECWIEAGELHEKVGFSLWDLEEAAYSYTSGAIHLDGAQETERATEMFKKGGLLFLELAKTCEELGRKEEAAHFYKRAAARFGLAGCEEKKKELNQKYKELNKIQADN